MRYSYEHRNDPDMIKKRELKERDWGTNQNY